MSGQVDFIVAPESQAEAILRYDDATESLVGASWKYLDDTKLYALYGLLAGRFTHYEQFCQQSNEGKLSPENDRLMGELLNEFPRPKIDALRFLSRFPQRFVELLAAVAPRDGQRLAAQWNACGDMRGWERSWVLAALKDLCKLARQAFSAGHVLFFRYMGESL